MAEIKLTLEETLKIKESIEWGYNYYTEELNQLGYTHQAKDNELEVYDGEGTLVGKSYLEKEGHVTSRKFEAITSVPPQVEELSNHLLLYQITMRSTERDIALLQQESLVKETAVKYGSKEEVPARIFPAPEHGSLKNISFEGIPSEEARTYLKEHSWRYSRRNRAWYPGTKEAQATNEAFVKGFVQKFYPNSLPEAPQTHSDIPILEELAKDGMVHLHCTTKDLSDGISLKNKPVVLKLTSKQAAVLIDASIKQRFMDNRQAKQPTPLNIAAKSKMEENFFTGLKTVHPQLTRKEADKQYHQVYSLIEKELKELRHEPVKQKSISRKSSGMEW